MTKDSNPTEMTLVRFQAILDAYGASPARWPEAERNAAELFLRTNADAATAALAARELDDALNSAELPLPSTALQDRLLRDFQARQSQKIVPFKARRAVWVQWGALAASLVVCVTAAWVVMSDRAKVDLSDDQAWESLGDDLEFAAAPTDTNSQTP